uniref:Uncharacterized protein n=1 Tax=Romanomermis culicivorax TaxID=13658 RepID=A0A915HTK7_ROMCU
MGVKILQMEKTESRISLIRTPTFDKAAGDRAMCQQPSTAQFQKFLTRQTSDVGFPEIFPYYDIFLISINQNFLISRSEKILGFLSRQSATVGGCTSELGFT